MQVYPVYNPDTDRFNLFLRDLRKDKELRGYLWAILGAVQSSLVTDKWGGLTTDEATDRYCDIINQVHYNG